MPKRLQLDQDELKREYVECRSTAKLGLVPPKDQPWPNQEYLERARHLVPGKRAAT